MMYNKDEHSRYVRIAGKVSIAAAVVGFAVFLVAFLVDVGSQEIGKQASAQTASTTLTVLNTPPVFTVAAYEVPDSATSTPINTGDIMQWQAVAVDSNSAPYFLLICSDNASPTAAFGGGGTGLGDVPPVCDAGAVQWGVSASTTSGTIATVSTTTASTAISQFDEANTWYAWVCDDAIVNPRCSNLSFQGPTTTSASSSPFHVNNPPNLSSVPTPVSADPGGDIVFTSVSEDPDSVGGQDDILIVVCQNAVDYNATTNDCDQNFLASTTISLTSDATATYTLPLIIRDQAYPAEVFLIDEHGHESPDNPITANFSVNNVAPVVLGGDIDLNGGVDMLLTVPGGETTGFTLDFTVRDANSCVNFASTSEITNYNVALFRDDLNSTTTCDGSNPAHYDPNDCYTTGVSTTTVWTLNCTADWVTDCTGPAIDQLDYTCTFPLWFVADPTDLGVNTPVAFSDDQWSVGVSGSDDNFATSSMATTTQLVEVESSTYIDLLTAEIPYGSLEPGSDSGTLNASTTVLNVGNTGLDQELLGDSMCGTYTATTTKCPVSATSTIPEDQQQFASTSVAYGSPLVGTLSSTTWQEIEQDVNKSTSTSTPFEAITYWGIAVPASITLAGDYQGLNTFMGITAEPADWTP